MIPAPFEYVRAASLDAASATLAADEDAKVLAGGMSLIPLMRLRLSRPTTLVDIGPLRDALSYVRDDGDTIVLGALTRHHDVAESPALRQRIPLLAHAAGLVGDPQVRHRGTVGGAVAHADPAGDLPAVLCTLDATIVVHGASGRRVIAASDFFRGFLETALAPGDLVAEVRVPVPRRGHGWAYTKFTRRAQDWAMVAVAVIVERSDGAVARAAIGLANMGPTPLRAAAAEAAVSGQDGEAIERAAEHAAEGTSPLSDLAATADFRRHLARVLTRRTLGEALHRAST